MTAPEREDPFRGTAQRWTIETGSLAGTVWDCAFHEDWSLAWRIVAGDLQGQVGRARLFQAQRMRPEVFLLAFATTRGVTMLVAVDFGTRCITGYEASPAHCHAFTGRFELL